MFRKLIATDSDIATTIVRLVLGVIFFAHGAQKTLGWFGGSSDCLLELQPLVFFATWSWRSRWFMVNSASL